MNLAAVAEEDWLALIGLLERVAFSAVGTNGKHVWVVGAEDHAAAVGSSSAASFLTNLRKVAYSRNIVVPDAIADIIPLFVCNDANGGWSSIILFTRLLKAAHSYGIGTFGGYRLSLRLLDAYFSSNDQAEIISLDWAAIDMIEKVVLSVASSVSWLLEKEVAHLCRLFCDIAAAAEESVNGNVLLPYLFYTNMPGLAVRNTTLRSDTLFMDVPCCSIKTVENAVIAVFDCSLEFAEVSGMDNFASVELSLTGIRARNIKHEEQNSLLRFLSSLLRNNVRVLACQKRIHPFLQRACQNAGIVCIPRVSQTYIGALVRLTGARLLGSYGSMLEEESALLCSCFGYISRLKNERIYAKSFVSVSYTRDPTFSSELSQVALAYCRSQESISSSEEAVVERGYHFARGVLSRRKSMISVLICAPLERYAMELRNVFEHGARQLNTLLADPRLLLGGGRWQRRTGQVLLSIYEHEVRRRGILGRLTVDENVCVVLADDVSSTCPQEALEEIICHLLQLFESELMALDSCALLGIRSFGHVLIHLGNALLQPPRGDVSEPGYDPYVSAVALLNQAVEAATNMYSIDGVILKKPRVAASYA